MKTIQFSHTRMVAKKPFGKHLKAQGATDQCTLRVPQSAVPLPKRATGPVTVNPVKVSPEVYKANRVSAYVPLVP